MSPLWPSLLLLEENVDLLISKIYFYNEVLCGVIRLYACVSGGDLIRNTSAVYEFP